ncbi:MAG: hypothetical protein RI988_1742 [Pseudomonadota bacterium]|jgi:uncharacterized cupin superfamily protein
MSFSSSTPPQFSATLRPVRRVVTGLDAQGRSVVTHEGQAPGQHENAVHKGRGFTDFWVWRRTPQPLHGGEDTGLWPDEFPGPAQGGHLRMVHWLSDGGDPRSVPPIVAPHAPKRAADGGRSWDRGGGNNVCISDMHKTESLDFGIVVAGERILVCDEGRTTIVPGDIVVQVGAWHLWDSSARGCHMAFDMFSADFGPGDGTHGLMTQHVPTVQPPAGRVLPAGLRPQRRVVTIDHEPGRSRIVCDAPSPDVRLDPARPGFALHRVWVAERHPAPMVTESLQLPHVLVPPPTGAVLNVLDIPPDEAWQGRAGVAEAQAWYASVGAEAVATCGSLPGHPWSQRSNTVDFLVVTEGEITLVLDTGETTLKAGEIGVVRGGNHAIGNRSGRPARVAVASHDAVAGA